MNDDRRKLTEHNFPLCPLDVAYRLIKDELAVS